MDVNEANDFSQIQDNWDLAYLEYNAAQADECQVKYTGIEENRWK